MESGSQPSSASSSGPWWLRDLHTVPAIVTWYFFNITTLLMNKYIFQMWNFRFPIFLTLVHMVVSALGAPILNRRMMSSQSPRPKITSQDYIWRVVPVALLHCSNIMLGNVAMSYIPVSFFATIKALVPAMNSAMQYLFLGQTFSLKTNLAIGVLVLGVSLASYTELSFDWFGFVAAMACTFLQALTSVVQGIVLTGEHKVDSLTLLEKMSPISSAILLPCVLLFERDVFIRYDFLHQDLGLVGMLLGSGLIAFGLNYSQFHLVSVTSSLTYVVSGNLKAVIAIVLSVWIFKNPITLLNAAGCALGLVGVFWYQIERLQENAR
eukprot:PhF_6_TR42164/c0_g1_i1/m.63729